MPQGNGGAFEIGGKRFYAQSIKYSWESLASEDSGRTLDGVMHIYWVKRKIRKLEITMPPCTYQTIADIINSVQGKEYTISYIDPASNEWTSAYVYTSNSKSDIYSGILYGGLY